MIEFVNKRSGLVFMVADERKEEYLEAGHKLASEVYAKKPEKKVVEKPIEEKAKKATPKKATKKK